MARFVSKDKREIGLSPDELIFRGEAKMDEVFLRIIDFDASNLLEEDIKNLEEAFPFQNKDTVTWFNIDGLHNTQALEKIGKGFGLEKMVIAEVLNAHARPRIQEYDNCLFISLKMLRESERSQKIKVENLSIVIMDNVLLSFQELKGDVFDPVRDRIRKQKPRIRNSGTDYLAFALLDIVIDNYIYLLGLLGERIESLEDKLLHNPSQSVINEINRHKRELNFLRKCIKPAKEMVLTLSKLESDFLSEKTENYYKELLENIHHANESCDSYRDILSDQLNIYHTTLSSKLNDVMKFLTIFSVIFIPLTFIAGIYGTNFDFVPELHYKYSYFIMWALMIVLTIIMLIFFRRKKWL